jgi:predicted DNA-binding WGR domain protein
MSNPSASSTVRRFELSSGRSHKFWEISAVDTEVTVRFGRIGTVGQTKVKSFADAKAAAAQHIEQLVGQKVKKRYCPIG